MPFLMLLVALTAFPSLDSYNPVWTTQSTNAVESMPVGGGDTGANVWVEHGDIFLYVQRSGTFDENNAFLKQGRVRVRLEPNPFASGQLFRQELKLRSGYVEIKGSDAVVNVWIEVHRPVVHIDIESKRPVSAFAQYESWRTADRELPDNGSRFGCFGWDAYPGQVFSYKDTIEPGRNAVVWYHRNRNEKLIFDTEATQQGLETVKGRLWNPLTIGLLVVLTVLLPAGYNAAQETRGMIHGRVLDASQAVLAGATVLVENTDTNTATRLTTNQTGYYEARLLLPGNYRVSAEFAGFKKTVRSGLVLPLSGTLDIDLALEVGGVAETISVTALAPVLETSTVSSGRVLDNRSIADLPVIVGNTMVLVKMTPGLFTRGVNDYLGPHSISGASDYSTGAGVGGNEWSIDGVPSNGASRQTAYLPHSDTVQEMRVETSNFDASAGHGTLANITMMTKAGTNRYHGTLSEQHWHQRWQGTNFYTRQLYYQNIAAAEAKGDTALANQLRSQDKQDPGRSNNYVLTFGGPVRIPKLYNGRDRLFFFASYQGNKDQVADLPSRINTTLPTLDDRTGDFSRFLLVDPVRYQIYDPLSVRADPARPGHYIRDPFPGNILPKTRIVNPVYDFYAKVLPTPNNDTDPRKEPLNNYLSGAPLIRDSVAYGSRIDFHQSDKHRFFGRWTYNNWGNYANDWTYKTMKGLQSNDNTRRNLGGTVDWVYTLGSNTVLDVALASNEYREGNVPKVAVSFKPSDVGLPTYLDEKAGDQHIMPTMNFSGYNAISRTYPTMTRYRTTSGKGDLTHVRGSHTLRAGIDVRNQYRTGGGGGNTSGTFSFGNTYTRKNDDSFTPAGSLALSWAAFMMGSSGQHERGDHRRLCAAESLLRLVWSGQLAADPQAVGQPRAAPGIRDGTDRALQPRDQLF